MDDVGLFVTSGYVIACDLREVVLDNKLSEDHVEMNILYCPNDISAVMTIWKWSLTQTIVDGYSLRQLSYLMMTTTYQLLMKREKLE